MGSIRWIHLIGIGGIGMSGIAEVLINLGYKITGSDVQSSISINRLIDLGAKIFIGHRAENVIGADVIVVSSAIDQNNPEIIQSLINRIPVIPRAQMLAELMRFKHGIAICGTHGKTTTTSLVASVLAEAGLDPTCIIGGRLNHLGSNARLGEGKYLVAEADESDASFLALKPLTAIVTNIDSDHMDTYQNNLERLEDAFVSFLQNLPFYGLVIACADDIAVSRILPRVGRTTKTYGFSDIADYQVKNLEMNQNSCRFSVSRPKKSTLDIQLAMPGRHNVQNSLGAVAIGDFLELPDEAISSALRKFEGVGRRFEIVANLPHNDGTITVIDDYGHHPKELTVTFETVRTCFPGKRLVNIFQPHRFSRTRDLFDDFVAILCKADVLILMDVHSAGEVPITGAASKDLASAIRDSGGLSPQLIQGFEEILNRLFKILSKDDVLLLQGAGSIGNLSQFIKNNWSSEGVS